MTIAFTLARPTVLLNWLMRAHYHQRTKAKRALAWEVRCALGRQVPARPLERAEIRITRRSSGALPDQDNAMGGLKHLLDVLQPMEPKRRPYGLGVIASDAPSCITVILLCERVGAKAQGTEVQVVPLPPPENGVPA